MEDKLIDEIFRAWARVQYHHESGEWLPDSDIKVKGDDTDDEASAD